LAPDRSASEPPVDKPSNEDQGGIPDRLHSPPTLAIKEAPPAREFTPPPTAEDLVCKTPPTNGNEYSVSPRTPPDDFLMDDSEPSNWEYGYEQDEYESTPVAFRFQGVQGHDGDSDELNLTINPWSPSPK